MAMKLHDDIDLGPEDELVVEKLRVEMVLQERWDLTELGRQYQQERRQCAETVARYEPIDVACLRCGAVAGSVCASTHKTGPQPFPQMHAVRIKLATVAHRECPVSDCAAGVGQPCVRVIGPVDARGIPNRQSTIAANTARTPLGEPTTNCPCRPCGRPAIADPGKGDSKG